MYDKAGLVLRVETVINNPEEFRVRKKVTRKGMSKTEWVPMRKGVAWLFHYREVFLDTLCRRLEGAAVSAIRREGLGRLIEAAEHPLSV